MNKPKKIGLIRIADPNFKWKQNVCIDDNCHAWSAFGSKQLTLPPASDVPEKVSTAIHQIKELLEVT